MPATPEQLASYLSVFAEWRAAGDTYHGAVLRLICGETVNVTTMQANAIELAVLHFDLMQRAVPLVSKGAFAKLALARSATGSLSEQPNGWATTAGMRSLS